MNAESLARIDGFMAEATRELFASQGLSLEPRPGREPDFAEPLLAAIGFTSEKARGTLVLTVERSLAEGCLPVNLRGKASPEILVDWTGELSNQLLGRLKSRFCGVGLDLALSTPTVFIGRDIRHFSRSCPIQRSLPFDGGGSCLVEFHACFAEDLELGEEIEDSCGGTAPEGEALFF